MRPHKGGSGIQLHQLAVGREGERKNRQAEETPSAAANGRRCESMRSVNQRTPAKTSARKKQSHGEKDGESLQTVNLFSVKSMKRRVRWGCGREGWNLTKVERGHPVQKGLTDRTPGKAPRGWSRPAIVKCPFPPEMGLESSSLAGRPLPLKVKQKRVSVPKAAASARRMRT